MLTSIILLAAILVTDWFNQILGHQGLISYILIAIIFGMLTRNTVGVPDKFQPGIGFALRKLLRLGIILLGIRLSVIDVAVIGAWGIPIIVGCIMTGLIATIFLNSKLKLPDRLGILIAVGTSICGASAIVATAPTIKATDEEVSYAVANITVFGIVAMLLYPYLAHFLFNGTIVQVGLFTGTSIHETAQVAGAGLIYDQTFGVTGNPNVTDIAVVTKLVRNMMMVIIIPGMAFLYARNLLANKESVETEAISVLKLVPLFIFGFLLMAVIRSVGDANVSNGALAFGIWGPSEWETLYTNIKSLSGYILAAAMAGVGLGTSFRTMKGLGLKPFGVGLIAAMMVGVVSIILVMTLGPMVQI